MKIGKDPTIAVLNDILSHIQRKKMEAMRNGTQDELDAYDSIFRFVADTYYEKVAKWKCKHPISVLIMNIRHKRRLKRLRELSAEIRGIFK